MLSSTALNAISKLDITLAGEGDVNLAPPPYDPQTHYLEVASSQYFRNILKLRHIVKALSDDYMGNVVGAQNIDLFMLTPSISSPMGPGSDSEAIPIKLGRTASYLTDSSQFGFEPILMNDFEKVYCYLPSMRGESPDKRHLNQFFHCEAEIKGDLQEIMDLAEGYIKYLCLGVSECTRIMKSVSQYPQTSLKVARSTALKAKFRRITFDEACEMLINNGFESHINTTSHGRDISSDGEIELLRILKTNVPVWVTHFDRDRVSFYQKPDPQNTNQVLCADLLCPPMKPGCFGGEVIGAGQRQDNTQEMYDSLDNQRLSPKPYEWYINLRNDPRYMTTAGFGLGVERYISWVLGLEDIKDAIVYPRLKNAMTMP